MKRHIRRWGVFLVALMALACLFDGRSFGAETPLNKKARLAELIQRLKSTDAQIRDQAVKVLSEPETLGLTPAEVVPALIEAAAEAYSFVVLEGVASVLRQFDSKEAVEVMIQALKDDRRLVRLLITDVLRKSEGRNLPRLCQALEDDRRVREGAAVIVAATRLDKEEWRQIRSLVGPGIEEPLIQALESGSDKDLDILTGALEKEGPALIRILAARALAAIGTKQAVS
ncbi:MAG: HEAT repeat domain-containing protein, partial [Pseudomonadota bacterium]